MLRIENIFDNTISCVALYLYHSIAMKIKWCLKVRKIRKDSHSIYGSMSLLQTYNRTVLTNVGFFKLKRMGINQITLLKNL